MGCGSIGDGQGLDPEQIGTVWIDYTGDGQDQAMRSHEAIIEALYV